MNQERVYQLMKMLEEDGNDPFLQYALALEYSTDSQFVGKSIELLFNLKQQQPDYLPLYYQLALLLKRSGEESRAMEIACSGKVLADIQGNHHTALELEGLIDDME